MLSVLTGNDVDDACYGIAAVEGTGGSFHDFNALNVVRVNQCEVVLATVVTMQAPPVYQYQDVGVAQAVHLQVRPHVVLAEGK